MSAQEIRAALERLRGASLRLRRRPARETTSALASVLETWRDPDSEVRGALRTEYADATGFSPAMVEAGMARALAGWTGDALRSLVDRELGGTQALEGTGIRAASGFEVTSVLLAGALPTPTLIGLLAPLVLRSSVLAKASAHDPVTARLVARSVAAADPELGACIEVVAFPGSDRERVDSLLAADCVVASGSDQTLSSVASRVEPPRRLVGYGHRLSVTALAPDRPADSAARVAEDVGQPAETCERASRLAKRYMPSARPNDGFDISGHHCFVDVGQQQLALLVPLDPPIGAEHVVGSRAVVEALALALELVEQPLLLGGEQLQGRRTSEVQAGAQCVVDRALPSAGGHGPAP